VYILVELKYTRIYFLEHYSGPYGAGDVAVLGAQALLVNHGDMALMSISAAASGSGTADYTDIVRNPYQYNGTWANINTFSGTYTPDGTCPLRYKKKGSTVYLQGWVNNSVGVSAVDTDQNLCTLAVGFRPSVLQNCIGGSRFIPDAKAIPIYISTAGVVTIKGSLLYPAGTTGGFSTNGVTIDFSFEID
jgi:hypothetical protein